MVGPLIIKKINSWLRPCFWSNTRQFLSFQIFHAAYIIKTTFNFLVFFGNWASSFSHHSVIWIPCAGQHIIKAAFNLSFLAIELAPSPTIQWSEFPVLAVEPGSRSPRPWDLGIPNVTSDWANHQWQTIQVLQRMSITNELTRTDSNT